MRPFPFRLFHAAILACGLAPCLGAQAARASGGQPGLLDSARAALASGRVEPAIRFAEQYTGRNARDPHGFVALGDAYFKRMPAGRFQALRAFEEAIRLAPRDPEPSYRYAQVGIYLGGDDGEGIARRGLERVIELDPFYRNAWDQWLLVFRNSSSRRRMRDRLEAFDSIPEVRARMAWLDIEDELYAIADTVLDGLIGHVDSTNAEWLAWRAQSAYEAGDAESGAAFYVRALAHANTDTAQALWRQAVGIARPDEIRAWDRIEPELRGAWLEAFWARRNPDLFAGSNARLAEHFARMRYARRNYPLLHPLVTYHRSQLARALNLEPAAGEREFYARCEMVEVMIPATRPVGAVPALAGPHASGGSRATDRARMSMSDDGSERVMADEGGASSPWLRTIFVSLNMDLRSIDSTAARIGYNLATGLEDRGIMYLRFGRPQGQILGGRNMADPHCVTPDVELWRYDGIGEIRFARPSAFSRGERTVSEMVFRSMNAEQFDAMRTALTRDETASPAPLEFGVWTAQFAGARPGTTEIAVVSTRGALAAVLAGTAGGISEVRRGPAGVVVLEAAPGSWTLLAHARDSAELGRQELRIQARAFTGGPAVSDLLLSPSWPSASAMRWEMMRRLERSLVFDEGQAMRVYAELYGLLAVSSSVRYTAEYTLLRTNNPSRDWSRDVWEGGVQLRFDRDAATEGNGQVTREVIDITPERLPPGRYLLRLRVVDRNAERDVGRSQISFEVR